MSRGLGNLVTIVRVVVDFLKNREAVPFIVPAMGSHGGANSFGQAAVLDPNIIGRATKGILEGYQGPSIKRIVVAGISKASKGNAIGIGLSDSTVKSLLPGIDPENSRIVIIKNTLELEHIEISEALCPKARACPSLEFLE